MDVEDSTFNSKMAAAGTASSALGKTIAGTGANFASFASQASSALNSVASALGTVLKVSIGVSAALALTLGSAAKASWDYLTSVQQSTLALKAYTGSADAARGITKELIAFAKSDVGVLFNRKELLGAAQALAGYGAEASRVADYVKIMSRAVATGNTTFEELAPILGRIAAQGKITSTDFDVLTGRGIILDKSMRGAAVSFDTLFAAISQAIPADILDQQANTVNGAVIRLQTAFRELGDAILGVEYGSAFSELGATFVSGGLGDTIVNGIKQITLAFKSPETVGAIQAFGKQIADVLGRVLPVVIRLIPVVAQNLDSLAIAIGGVAAAWATLKTAAIGFSIAATLAQAAASPVLAIIVGVVVAIAALVAGLTVAAAKFGLFDEAASVVGDALSRIKSFVDAVAPAFQRMVGTIRFALSAVWNAILEVTAPIRDALREAFGDVNWAQVFTTAFNLIGTAFRTTAKIIIDALNFLKPAFELVAAAIPVVVNVFQTMLIPAFMKFWATIQPLLPLLKFIGAVIVVAIVGALIVFTTAMLLAWAVVGAVVAGLAALFTYLWNIGVQIFQGLADFVIATWNNIKNTGEAIWNAIKTVIQGVINNIMAVVSAGVSVIVNVWNGLRAIVGIVSSAVSGAYNAIAGFVGRFVQVGSDIIGGVLRGLRSAAGDIIGFIQNLFGDVIAIAKRILKIGSPSKVFMDVGKDLMLGMQLGILAGADGVSRALGQAIPTTSPIGNITGPDGTAAVSGTGVTNQFFPKQLTEADIDMAASRSRYQQGLALR